MLILGRYMILKQVSGALAAQRGRELLQLARLNELRIVKGLTAQR